MINANPIPIPVRHFYLPGTSPGIVVQLEQELLVRQEDKDYQIADMHRDMYVLYCEKKLTNWNLWEETLIWDYLVRRKMSL